MERIEKKIPCQGTSYAGIGENTVNLGIKEKQITEFNVFKLQPWGRKILLPRC